MHAIAVCDCCGLCCQRLIVESSALDVLREPRIAIERPLGRRDPTLCILDACWIVAAPGLPCPFLTAERRCGIYPTRPNTCVSFAAGSPKCLQLRGESGLGDLAACSANGEAAEVQAAMVDDGEPAPPAT